MPSANAPSSARQSTNQTREPIAGRLATSKGAWSRSPWRNNVFLEEVDRPPIVARDLVDHPQVVIGHDLESGVPEAHRDGKGALAGGNGMLSVTLPRIIQAPIGGDTPQPPLVVQGLGEAFGFT